MYGSGLVKAPQRNYFSGNIELSNILQEKASDKYKRPIKMGPFFRHTLKHPLKQLDSYPPFPHLRELTTTPGKHQ